MKKLYLFIITVLTINIAGPGLWAEGADTILISEVLIGGTGSASQEFIEIYNPSNMDINLSDWKIQYASASGTSWTTKITLNYIIASNTHMVFCTTEAGLDNSSGTFKSGLSQSGGRIRVIDSSNTIIDSVGWGNSLNAEGSPATAPGVGVSIQRKIVSNLYQDTDNNTNDFVEQPVPSPGEGLEVTTSSSNVITDTQEPEASETTAAEDTQTTPSDNTGTSTPPDPSANTSTTNSGSTTPSDIDEGTNTTQEVNGNDNSGTSDLPNDTDIPRTEPDSTTQNQTADTPIDADIAQGQTENSELEAQNIAIELSEVLPNPAMPVLDSEGEFIEIYNPNSHSVDISSFKILVGATDPKQYTLKGELKENEYKAIYISESGLVLPNSGTVITIMQDDKVIDTATYGEASDGKSWSKINGNWLWSNSQTPSTINMPSAFNPEILSLSTITKTTSTPKLAAVKTAKTPVATAKKSTAAQTTKKPAAATTTSTKKSTAAASKVADAAKTSSAVTPQPKTHSINRPWLLAIIGVFGLGYLLYDYREDLSHIYRQFKSKRAVRRASS